MCDCTSCSYTDGFAGKGFAEWPKGEPKGSVTSAKEYREHAIHCGSAGLPKPRVFKPGQPPKFSTYGLVMPVQQAPKFVLDWINRKAPDQAEARPASPETPAKAPQHFPAQDRPRETARIYAMPKAKESKQPRGRPAIPGRRIVIKLTEEQIKRAEKKGDGNVSAGIRKALGG
jgi:hypothetical protein